jgi:hypothetical protein
LKIITEKYVHEHNISNPEETLTEQTATIKCMIDENSKEIFSWLLDRAKAQIKIFTMIIEDITCNFYGDMQ